MEIIKKIYKDKFAFGAFIALALLYLVILFADFIAPYSNCFSNREMSYAPPSKVYTIDENKEYSKEDYERCASVISDYIMSHSKNEIPRIEMEFSSVLRKII